MVRKGGSVRAKPQGHEVERREGFQVVTRVQREAGGSGLWLWGQGGEPAQLGSRRGCGRSPAGKQKPREPKRTEGCLESCVPRDPGPSLGSHSLPLREEQFSRLLMTGKARPY